jgi:ferrous iron transport protein A
MAVISLADMESGQKGKVSRIQGGHGLCARLEAMGVRPGATISKVSGQLMRGPVIVKVGATQIAIGFGMARRVEVEV